MANLQVSTLAQLMNVADNETTFAQSGQVGRMRLSQITVCRRLGLR